MHFLLFFSPLLSPLGSRQGFLTPCLYLCRFLRRMRPYGTNAQRANGPLCPILFFGGKRSILKGRTIAETPFQVLGYVNRKTRASSGIPRNGQIRHVKYCNMARCLFAGNDAPISEKLSHAPLLCTCTLFFTPLDLSRLAASHARFYWGKLAADQATTTRLCRARNATFIVASFRPLFPHSCKMAGLH